MFHQTVLQRPGDEEARLSRDKMPGEQVATYTARSPTQTSYQYSPTSRAQNSNPPTPAPPPLHSTFNNARNPPNSPTSTGLPPIASALYARETPSSNYYDPTQDPGDRSVGRNSDRFQSPFPAQSSTRDSYNYTDSRSSDRNPYHSPVASTFPHQSPLPPPPSYPPPRPEPLAQSPVSPKMYHAFNRVNNSSYPSERRQSQDMAQPEGRPSTANKSDAATPSRKADPMSLSSIMSGTNHEPPPHVTKDASHSSNTYDAPPVKEEIIASPPRSKEVTDLHNVKPAMAPSDGPKRIHDIINGTPLSGPSPTERFKPDEREVEAEVARIDAVDISDIDAPGFEAERLEYRAHNQKRTLEVGSSEESKRKRRRTANIKRLHDVFNNRAIYHKERYFKTHENEAWQEVQQQEIAEEKERKKDMQRKRRREKTLANESQKRAEALEKAEQAADEEEKQRLLKEAQKHDGRLKRTSQLLQQGGTPSKDIREVTPHAPNLEGGTMSTFQMSEDGPVKKRGRQGARPRKSKEQKQAEKDAAAAAQAAIDQGLTPQAIAPKEEARLSRLESIKRDRSQTEEASSIAPEDARPDFIPYSSDAYNDLYRQIWKDIGKAVPKVYRIKDASLSTKQSNLRKTAQLAAKEARRWQIRTNKSTKDVQARAKRSMREMLSFWKRNERDERDQRKMAERQELENAKKAEAEREANRQKRKLNFLISQTELFSHFVGKKVKTAEAEKSTNDVAVSDETVQPGDADMHTVDLPDSVANVGTKVTNFEDLDFDAEDETALKQAAMANAQNAVQEAQDRALAFNNQGQADFDEGEMNFQNPTSLQNMDVAQPKMLTCQLKEYQLKGLNWLVNLYEQGINGILADEMGLGKTVQSISVMSYLAEAHNIWGPFLVIAPASTLHNWQQEITRFVPDLKVLPYWGNAKDRKVLRKFWDRKHITYRKESPFHVLVTSYQLVVQDAQYFQKIRWQYMVLDEAQAIKSSQSSRWKSLLGFHCRNRLLLTGTPIQNNMQELWALLHFIMPSLFDSHDEFNDWFSKDIESHAQSNTKLNEDQLKRLHMILKPFMLRRIKKHVQKELGDKIELDIFCDLTYRQRAYYTNLRNKISIIDLIEKAAVGDDQDTATLMNLVMQFRKVCNHPDLFERAETISPFSFSYFAETASFMREGHNIHLGYSVRNLIEYRIPRLVGRDSGRIYLAGSDNAKAGWRGKYLQHLMNIWEADHVLESSRTDGAFSWLRFTDVSASEVCSAARNDIFQRAVDLRRRPRHLTRFKSLDEGDNKTSPMHALFNIRETNNIYDLSNDTKQGRLFNLLNVTTNAIESGQLSAIELAAPPGASAPPIELYCASQGVIAEKQRDFFNVPMQSTLFDISTKTEEALLDAKVPPEKFPVSGMLPAPQARKSRYTNIQVPSMRRFVTDSGKLAKLDQLLKKLKNEGHRVLLYFQMTRMIDLMEEYLTYRNYKYCRLDGSTKLEDRRDTVADFQTRPDIFVFLLSTRAGGLGINLTSADTVIFYDSDWNPTIDSQAMDRAHRLGQTKQVTVYRLITRGTIEERIRKRALQKEEVQRVVISGGAGAHVDFNTRSRENRTKDIAMWLADDDQAELIERKEQELAALEASGAGQAGKKKRGGVAKRKADMSLDDMYHEGEGHFDDASAKPSGAATPVPAGSDAAAGAPPGKRRKGISKKAKTAKQRLAIADGMVDI